MAKVSFHATDQFKSETPDPDQKNLNYHEASQILIDMWERGEEQHSKLLWIQKFKKYGLEEVEHRKYGNWVLTKDSKSDMIITAHFKTVDESAKERDQPKSFTMKIRQRNKRYERWTQRNGRK